MGVILKEGRIEADAPDANNKVTTSKGETIDADLILKATGFVYAGAKLLDPSLRQDAKDNGQLVCKPTLQLKSCETIFCAGEIVAVPANCYADVKGSKHAEMTGATVAANIVAILSKKNRLKSFQWSSAPIQAPCMTALGTEIGVGDMGLPGCLNNIGNVMTHNFKCKDYYMSIQGANFGKGKTWGLDGPHGDAVPILETPQQPHISEETF